MKTIIMKLIQIFIVVLALSTKTLAEKNYYNVQSYGAIPDGITDSSEAFEAAWSSACKSWKHSTILVPQGWFMIGKAITFSGQGCKSKGIDVIIRGTIVGPTDFRALTNTGLMWLLFDEVNNVKIYGGGVLDAHGSGLWDCKQANFDSCPRGISSLGLTRSKNIEINGIRSVNSQLFHIVINGCKNVRVEGVKISASGDSPNTDGIHVQLSTNVTIMTSNIATGDDCISVGPGTTNLWMENIICGPGHGISIGSLGKEYHEHGVQNVTVKTATFIGTQNGVRIKSWGRPSKGFVKNVLFQHLTMVNAQNPIIIDQKYCPYHKGCPGQVSGVRIRDVTYRDIHGSSSTPIAVKFDCSSKYECLDLKLEDVNLTYDKKPASSSCTNVRESSFTC